MQKNYTKLEAPTSLVKAALEPIRNAVARSANSRAQSDEASAEQAIGEACTLGSPREYPEITLFDEDDLASLCDHMSTSREPSTADLLTKILHTFNSKGSTRYLRTVDSVVLSELHNLRRSFPNFHDVVDYLEAFWWLSYKTDYVLRFPPILLSGPAGVGKTRFARKLSQIVGTKFCTLNVAALQSGAELGGSSSFWSNATPGIIFDALVNQTFANPLIFLDEIDKASVYRDAPLAALYVLLEPESAKNFQDQCYNIKLDASHLMFIAACNDPDEITGPIRSRFREFKIEISTAQSLQISKNIISEAIRELGPAGKGIQFSEQAISSLAEHTPRMIRQIVAEAIGRALRDRITVITAIPSRDAKKQPVGFLR